MAIKQDSNQQVPVNAPWGYEQGWQVHCDKCRKTSTKAGEDPGVAADNARSEGFQTQPNGIHPSLWFCYACDQAKRKARANPKSA